MRQWHHMRDGCAHPTPVSLDRGSSHASGGMGLTPSHPYTPSRASQNLPHDVTWVGPPRDEIQARAETQRASSAGTPRMRSDTYDSTVPNMVEWPSMWRPKPPSAFWWLVR